MTFDKIEVICVRMTPGSRRRRFALDHNGVERLNSGELGELKVRLNALRTDGARFEFHREGENKITVSLELTEKTKGAG